MGTAIRLGSTEDDLVGGHVAIDFLNTAGGATKARDVERLVDYSAALRWGAATNLLTEDEGKQLARLAETVPEAAEDALGSLRAFRETLHVCLMAEQAGSEWPSYERSKVERQIKTALCGANLNRVDECFLWTASAEQCGLALILVRVALATESLLRSDDLARMRNCERCSWLFVDRGRGKPRRWCSMAACGSRAKSARYYRRHRQVENGEDV
jgi:predicted RNA-binding Zn ribbon-like protein